MRRNFKKKGPDNNQSYKNTWFMLIICNKYNYFLLRLIEATYFDIFELFN